MIWYNFNVEMQVNTGAVLFNGRAVSGFGNTAPATWDYAPCLRLDNDSAHVAGVYFMKELNPCGCGCGEMITGFYKRGHWFKTPDGREFMRQRAIKQNTGRIWSEEVKEKIRRSNMGKKMSPEARAKISKANTGRKQSGESIEKSRLSKIGLKPSAETRARMSAAQKKRALEKPETLFPAHNSRRGKPIILNPEQKEKFLVAINGRKYGPEARANMRKGQRARAARTKPHEWGGWRGGISQTPYPVSWDSIKREIRRRDGGLCMDCGKGDFSTTALKCADVHHINGNKQDCSEKNLISMCRSCHMKAQNHMNTSAPRLRAILTERYGYIYE